MRQYISPLIRLPFNRWDGIVSLIVLVSLFALAWGTQQMTEPFHPGQTLALTLSPTQLPFYAIRTVTRMLLAMVISLVFTFAVGTLAAKNTRAERVIIPFIDIMQSIPVLGFLSISIVPFLWLFPNSLLGPECAALFAIFTSQVWNMTLGFYQSLKTIPEDLKTVTQAFRLSPWQRFWRLDVPFAMPSLIWNMMVSMSAGWFFVVASEAITVANQDILLPGIGSYIHLAITAGDHHALGYAILTMFLVILVYDQLLFRPMVAWTERFKSEIDPEEESEAWFLDWIHRTRLFQQLLYFFGLWKAWLFQACRPQWLPAFPRPKRAPRRPSSPAVHWLNTLLFYGILVSSLLGIAWFLFIYAIEAVTAQEIIWLIYLGALTAVKVVLSVIFSSIIWVPVGVWIASRPKVAHYAQLAAQFFASFPPNIVYPLIFALILRYQLNFEIWTIPLMMLGTQWYILFNVISGAKSIHKELRLVMKSYHVKGWLWWKRLMLPALLPNYITGAMAAAGGCWNASIVAEVLDSGGTRLSATGLGAYIAEVTIVGDFPRIALSISIMCLYVMLFNHFVWQKLYEKAQSRYQMEAL